MTSRPTQTHFPLKLTFYSESKQYLISPKHWWANWERKLQEIKMGSSFAGEKEEKEKRKERAQNAILQLSSG